MTHYSAPDPDDVRRGHEIIERELERSMILPRPAACLRAILRLLDSAIVVLSEPTTDADPYRVAAGVALGIADGYGQSWPRWASPGTTDQDQVRD